MGSKVLAVSKEAIFISYPRVEPPDNSRISCFLIMSLWDKPQARPEEEGANWAQSTQEIIIDSNKPAEAMNI